ncbi:MAG: ArsR family transcriptional regulator [Phototrophicales bacterium]|nr:MAG: hypothetical protein CUN56_09060 [Phototrophicales bacterium]RMG76173.1 MAG: ArsR family transcriptional regulator [Chloroflexota bacterium]
MQETRQQILQILREKGQATVDDIVAELQTRRGAITAVTVRHHLNYLQKEQLITMPELKHRSTPGRPQHIYALTEKAHEHFPNNYRNLAASLLEQVQGHLPPDSVNVIIEGMVQSMAKQANVTEASLEDRLKAAVVYLNDQGYQAYFEQSDEGFILYTANCPYHDLAHTTEALCNMDMRLVASLIGIVPRMLSRVSDGNSVCAYLIPVG